MNNAIDAFEERYKKSSRPFDLSKIGGVYKNADMRQRWRQFHLGFRAGQESINSSNNLQNQEQSL